MLVMAQNPICGATAARREVLEQHVALRRLLRCVDAAARRVLSGAPANDLELPALMRLLRKTLLDHMAFEERFLVPVLHDVDPWGPERATHFLAEHERQRAVLATLDDEALTGHGAAALAVVLRSLVTDILLDMQEEERDFLTSEVLHDDLVVCDQNGG